MEGWQEKHRCGSNILLKNKVMANESLLFFVFDVRLAETQVSVTNDIGSTPKIIEEHLF